MTIKPEQQIKSRIESLQHHLASENPLLVDVVKSFLELDKVGYRTGLLSAKESFATHISWWPLISVLGTFSAGKSTFINNYLGLPLQKTGNQAVDDKFTVACFSQDQQVRTLPGLALDADPRFPFYQISEEIEKVVRGEGDRINTYLQLKTCPSDALRGRILIDSPGFDADAQRTSTLRITDHIIDLSDLVLVFFDARHPEPGAMQDTLEHLVKGTVRRNDANKVLFILNQIDTTANEDNLEEVVAAWQRALAQGGLASGRFYCIYNEDAAVTIEDEALQRRYRSKRDHDLEEIYQRIGEVSVERVYRIVGTLESVANNIENKLAPRLESLRSRWRKRVLQLDALIMVPVLLALLGMSINNGYWQGLHFMPPWSGSGFLSGVLTVLLLAAGLAVHFWVRGLVARRIVKPLAREDAIGNLAQAFLHNTRPWVSLFKRVPVGWGRLSRKRITATREAADRFVQKLNDTYTNPSGEAGDVGISD